MKRRRPATGSNLEEGPGVPEEIDKHHDRRTWGRYLEMSGAMTPKDEMALKNLVTKYGPRTILLTLGLSLKRPRGRPFDPFKEFEKASDAQWILEERNQLANRGVGAPLKNALIAFFFCKTGTDPSESELETLKKRFQTGRKIFERMSRGERSRENK